MTTATQTVRDESFYLERFKAKIIDGQWTNGRIVDSDYTCEIYKGFAIVTWNREIATPSKGVTRSSYQSFVWEVGSHFDHLDTLNWLGQGCVTSGFTSDNLDTALKKVRKKIDILFLMYQDKEELKALSITYRADILRDEESVFNASIGDVVALYAFGRTRLGKVIATTGSRFIVAYMTPSNSADVHYKTLPLNHLYPKERLP